MGVPLAERKAANEMQARETRCVHQPDDLAVKEPGNEGGAKNLRILKKRLS